MNIAETNTTYIMPIIEKTGNLFQLPTINLYDQLSIWKPITPFTDLQDLPDNFDPSVYEDIRIINFTIAGFCCILQIIMFIIAYKVYSIVKCNN